MQRRERPHAGQSVSSHLATQLVADALPQTVRRHLDRALRRILAPGDLGVAVATFAPQAFLQLVKETDSAPPGMNEGGFSGQDTLLERIDCWGRSTPHGT